MNIQQILEAQNPWWTEPRTRLALHHPERRDLQPKVLQHVKTEERRALVLLGPRQVGKTTLLEQVADDLLEEGLPASNLTYFDFSDDRLVEAVTAREIVDVIPVSLDSSLPRILLFDEISKAPRWDRWLKQAVDSRVGRVVATDSAASVLRGGGRESGQGRWDEVRMEGLSLREFHRLSRGSAKAESDPVDPSLTPATLERYLAIGGFPEHVRAENLPEMRRRLRADIVEKAILRDLASRVDDPRRVSDLFVYLMQESGSTFVTSHRADDLSADRRTVDAWVDLLRDTFLVARLDRRSDKSSHRLRNRPRYYAADHGLIMAFAPSADPVNDPEVRSRVFEAVVYRHLRDLPWPITFFRHKEDREVDFVVDHPDGPILVEVTHSRRVKDRKVATLASVGKSLAAVRRIVVHGGGVERNADNKASGVEQIPLLRFLQEPGSILPGKEG